MTDTETLARWLHGAATRLSKLQPSEYYVGWKDLKKENKARYRAVAAEILTNPPQVLIDACAAVPVIVQRNES